MQKIKNALNPGHTKGEREGEYQYGQNTYATTGEQAPTSTAACDTCVPAETATTGTTTVCGQEFFTKTEDRPVVKEQVERILEHHPVEKEFVTETRATGVERHGVGEVEHLGTAERIVHETKPKSPCDI